MGEAAYRDADEWRWRRERKARLADIGRRQLHGFWPVERYQGRQRHGDGHGEYVRTFSLKCFEAAKTSYVAALTWTPPTTQTDGSALTTLARYRVIYGKSLTTMTSSALIDAPATGGTVAADSSGTWYFKVRAVRTDGVESLDSQVVSKSLVGTTQAAEFVTSDAPVTITVLPNPPTSLTATEIAYEYRPATKTFAAIGLVPAGAQCGPETRTAGAAKYCRVTLADSRPIVWPQDRKLSEVWVRQ